MYEGKIIKFYRERAGITQEQLGKDICSATHVSKIELGQTHYSKDILNLLSKRLNIHIEREIDSFKSIQKQLEQWHEAIIMQRNQEMDRLASELESRELIHISDYKNLYTLLQARYHFSKNQDQHALKFIKKIQKLERKLSSYELNLLNHVLGIYYIGNQEFQKAIESLKLIKENTYQNTDYYYHLAISYHANNSDLMAYSCAEQALQFFRKTNNFLRVIDTEMLLLVMQRKDTNYNFNERLKKFESLLQSCELCHSSIRRATILHNLAYEYYCLGDYDNATRHYQNSMNLKEKKTGTYLNSLEGYIEGSIKGNLLSRSELLQLTEKGLSIAEKLNDLLYINLFKLPLYKIQEKHTVYYQYLSDHALPFFKTYGHSLLVNRYEKEMFHYYSKTGQLDKAVDIAQTVMNDR
ncbi:helix-turn-helix domain-containing protein [Pseudalkalibacillus decolorationis]|uniref:helix-turn-helix domain-containing protein n=1 Tax=Pseudalkalibacillus decolorationis TaxID=163879 RepID=UPI002147914D|nr:helix-turn-helix transcriptional regulator [Pseudalkalibacillus decolorationis]